MMYLLRFSLILGLLLVITLAKADVEKCAAPLDTANTEEEPKCGEKSANLMDSISECATCNLPASDDFGSCTKSQCCSNNNADKSDSNIKVFTIASDDTEAYERYIRSAKYNNIEVETLGVNEDQLADHKKNGASNIHLLREAVEPYKNDEKKIILFTDSGDVLFSSDCKTIVGAFEKSNAHILFGAKKSRSDETGDDDKDEDDKDDIDDPYPKVKKDQPRYLNPAMFIGYAPAVYKMLLTPIYNWVNDQSYYEKAFLDPFTREKLQIKLDHDSKIFQSLNGVSEHIRLEYTYVDAKYFVRNVETYNIPCVIHGNGPTKALLNNFGFYLGGSSIHNEFERIEEQKLENLQKENLPTVTVAIIILEEMPFLEEYFDKIVALEYPKDKLSLFIFNDVPYHQEMVEKFIETQKPKYANIELVDMNLTQYSDDIKELAARTWAGSFADQEGSDYLFVVDAEAHIDNSVTLMHLIEQNRDFIAPVLTRYESQWSNIQGAHCDKTFYHKNVRDYKRIVENDDRGLWRVPVVSSCYLVKRAIFSKLNYVSGERDASVALSKNLEEQDILEYVINLEDYGHLVNNEEFNTKMTCPDFYTLMTNQKDWENRYLHPNYSDQLKPGLELKDYLQPCPDVFFLAIGSDRFCDELVTIVEAYGKWSSGENDDERLDSGYENVPTRDIWLKQVGLHDMWLQFLDKYVMPLQEAVFPDYCDEPPRATMNFVVRYRPDEQASLRPHHDVSTYTINIALNSVGVDYEGGGCRFVRYNCSVTATQKGWMLLHPGRLSHQHEGLQTTNGTRYIMISFVDP